MDLWVVAAAAGAGYIAKNLQSLTADKKENLWEPALKHSVNVQSESRNFLQQIRYNTCPLRRLGQTGAQSEYDLNVNFSAIEKLGKKDSSAEIPSTSASISGREISEFEDAEGKKARRRYKSKFVSSRRPSMNYARPLISLENCVDSELSEVGRIEQNLFSKIPPVPTVRPLLVTDGPGMISRSSSGSSLAPFEGGWEERSRENDVGSKVRNSMLRSSSSELFDPAKLQKKNRKHSCLAQMNRSVETVSDKSFLSPGPDGMLLFVLGMTIGIFSATTTNKREVDNLNNQLKQTQTLIEDLHEELDMREMVTVKEIANEGSHQPVGGNDQNISTTNPILPPADEEVKKFTTIDNPQPKNKNNESEQLISKIEEELQAELELLEHTMKSSVLKTISNVVELDPGFEPDIAVGDLKPIMGQRNLDDASDSGYISTETDTNFSQPANYAVSPWELSFRLHELIESRLEDRIKGLEIALGNSQNRCQVPGSQNYISGARLSFSETEYSCSPRSPIYVCGHDTIDGSLAKNFSRNSGDSCKENSKILKRVTENSQERDCEKPRSNHKDYSVRKLMDDLFSEEQNSIPHHTVKARDGAPDDLVQDMSLSWGRQMSRSVMLDEDFESEDDEGTDESEMLLIKRIVDRSRSGSNFFFNFHE